MAERLSIPRSLRRNLTPVARELRRGETATEAILWRALRNRQLDGRKFKRQHRIGPFIVDFYCPDERLIVEIDGPIHLRQESLDRERQALLESTGDRVLRFTNEQIDEDLDAALRAIRSRFAPSPPAPLPLKRERHGRRPG